MLAANFVLESGVRNNVDKVRNIVRNTIVDNIVNIANTDNIINVDNVTLSIVTTLSML